MVWFSRMKIESQKTWYWCIRTSVLIFTIIVTVVPSGRLYWSFLINNLGISNWTITLIIQEILSDLFLLWSPVVKTTFKAEFVFLLSHRQNQIELVFFLSHWQSSNQMSLVLSQLLTIDSILCYFGQIFICLITHTYLYVIATWGLKPCICVLYTLQMATCIKKQYILFVSGKW